MKYVVLKLISIFSIVFCAALNYEEIIWGGQASNISGYIFIIFILLWIIIIYMAKNNISTLKMFLIMWSISAITLISLILARLNIVSGDWFIVIPYIFIFNSALYGLTYWVGSYIIVESIHFLISIVFIITTLIFIINERKQNEEK